MMAALSAGHGWQIPGQEWAATRAAEWLGAKPMIGCNHFDTIFAPVFAAIHPKAKFIYLRRDPEAVFRSFYGKQQWGNDNQLTPLLYAIEDDDSFTYWLRGMSEIDKIAWYLRFTEIFSRAFGTVLGERFIEISADKLFARDQNEIKRLLEFSNGGIPLTRASKHFAVKINEKAHRVSQVSDADIELFRQAVRVLT